MLLRLRSLRQAAFTDKIASLSLLRSRIPFFNEDDADTLACLLSQLPRIKNGELTSFEQSGMNDLCQHSSRIFHFYRSTLICQCVLYMRIIAPSNITFSTPSYFGGWNSEVTGLSNRAGEVMRRHSSGATHSTHSALISQCVLHMRINPLLHKQFYP